MAARVDESESALREMIGAIDKGVAATRAELVAQLGVALQHARDAAAERVATAVAAHAEGSERELTDVTLARALQPSGLAGLSSSPPFPPSLPL